MSSVSSSDHIVWFNKLIYQHLEPLNISVKSKKNCSSILIRGLQYLVSYQRDYNVPQSIEEVAYKNLVIKKIAQLIDIKRNWEPLSDFPQFLDSDTEEFFSAIHEQVKQKIERIVGKWKHEFLQQEENSSLEKNVTKLQQKGYLPSTPFEELFLVYSLNTINIFKETLIVDQVISGNIAIKEALCITPKELSLFQDPIIGKFLKSEISLRLFLKLDKKKLEYLGNHFIQLLLKSNEMIFEEFGDYSLGCLEILTIEFVYGFIVEGQITCKEIAKKYSAWCRKQFKDAFQNKGVQNLISLGKFSPLQLVETNGIELEAICDEKIQNYFETEKIKWDIFIKFSYQHKKALMSPFVQELIDSDELFFKQFVEMDFIKAETLLDAGVQGLIKKNKISLKKFLEFDNPEVILNLQHPEVQNLIWCDRLTFNTLIQFSCFDIFRNPEVIESIQSGILNSEELSKLSWEYLWAFRRGGNIPQLIRSKELTFEEFKGFSKAKAMAVFDLAGLIEPNTITDLGLSDFIQEDQLAFEKFKQLSDEEIIKIKINYENKVYDYKKQHNLLQPCLIQ
jgi:hypothetical protein